MGVKGWIKVHSYTDPRESIVGFERWILRDSKGETRAEVEAGRRQGRTVVAKIRGIDDRDEASPVGIDLAHLVTQGLDLVAVVEEQAQQVREEDRAPVPEPGEFPRGDMDGNGGSRMAHWK